MVCGNYYIKYCPLCRVFDVSKVRTLLSYFPIGTNEEFLPLKKVIIRPNFVLIQFDIVIVP